MQGIGILVIPIPSLMSGAIRWPGLSPLTSPDKKNARNYVVPGIFCLVAGTGFEPVTFGL